MQSAYQRAYARDTETAHYIKLKMEILAFLGLASLKEMYSQTSFFARLHTTLTQFFGVLSYFVFEAPKFRWCAFDFLTLGSIILNTK